MLIDRRNVNQFTVQTSQWLDLIAALYYWCVFVAREFLRYYEPTGLSFPRYWERRPPLFHVPWETHYMAITAVVFTWVLAAKYYHVHGAALGWTAALLIGYFFFALWNGPQLQVVSTAEGIFQMAVAINLTLYLTIHNWVPGWFLLMSITLWVIFTMEWVYALRLAARFARRQPRRPNTKHNEND
jgi:hypothetical protein